MTREERRDYEFPLRPGITIKIANVPLNISPHEIDRIENFLRTLADVYAPDGRHRKKLTG